MAAPSRASEQPLEYIGALSKSTTPAARAAATAALASPCVAVRPHAPADFDSSDGPMWIAPKMMSLAPSFRPATSAAASSPPAMWEAIRGRRLANAMMAAGG